MDRVLLEHWHVVAALGSLPPGQEVATRLLDTDLTLLRSAGDIVAAWPAASGRALPVCVRHGHVWTSLAAPALPLFDLPAPAVTAGSVAVHAPAPRVIDAFLRPGAETPHPYCVLRDGKTGIFVQPVDDERCILHLMAADDAGGADWRLEVERLKPILENQVAGRAPPGKTGWVPVARGDDLAHRHIFHTALDGQELAVWRDESGLANVWEDRCPHRDVRLTIGTHLGTELRCQLHGWRFASGSGRCVSFPAQVKTYPCVERHGLIWTTLDAAPEDIPDLGGAGWRPLRAVFVEARLAEIAPHLPHSPDLALFLQPVDAHRTIIHGLSADPAVTLRRHDDLLAALRDRIESGTP